MRHVRQYTQEFMDEAVDLLISSDRSPKEIADSLGIPSSTLRTWRDRKLGNSPEVQNKHHPVSNQDAEISRLRKELAESKVENEILKKAMAIFSKKKLLKFGFIKEHSQMYPVRKLCSCLNVSPSGFYHWLNKPLSASKLHRIQIEKEIKIVFESEKGRYGSPRIHNVLNDNGISCSVQKVARIMAEKQIKAIFKKKFRITTKSSDRNKPSPYVLRRDFSANRPNRKWVSDITYIWTKEGWLYLCIIIDLYSRKVIGWSVSSKIDADLLIDAFLMAVTRRKNKNNALYSIVTKVSNMPQVDLEEY